MKASFPSRNVIYLGLVFTLLTAVYALSYSGAFTTDDEHIFVSGAQSLARLGRLSANQVYGNSRVQGDFRGVEPALPAIGSLLDRLAVFARLGSVQTMFTLNAFVTALTGCFVYLTALRLGYRPEVSALTALAFGLGTMAWPYAKTFFRDPLAALMTAGAYLCVEMAQAPGRALPLRLRDWGLAAVLLAGGLLAKGTVAIVIIVLPVVALVRALAPMRRQTVTGLPPAQKRKRDSIGLMLTVVATSGLVAGFAIVVRLIPPGGALARLSWDYFAFLLRFFFTTPHPAFAEAVLGPLISPGKSFLLYSPVLALSLASIALVGRTRWRELLAPWLILAGLIVAQALFYDDEWWGHINWGLRYLLPALPLLAVTAAPAIEALLATRSRGVRFAGWTLIAMSVLVQIAAIAAPTRAYYTHLAHLGPGAAGSLAVWDPRHSAILGHWRLLFGGEAWDFAWARLGPVSPIPVLLVNAGWMLALGTSAWGLLRAGGLPFHRRAAPLVLALGLTLALPYALLTAYYRDPAYDSGRAEFRSAMEYVEAHSDAAADVILIESYAQPLWHNYLNYSRASVEWYSLPLHFPTETELAALALGEDPARALAPSTIALFERLPEQSRRLWLINDLDTPPGNFRLEERWLTAHQPLLGEWVFGDRIHVSLFSLE